jgi:hypothetical protein
MKKEPKEREEREKLKKESEEKKKQINVQLSYCEEPSFMFSY